MRVYGPNGTSVAATAAPMRRSAAGTFSIEGDKAARAAPSATAPRVIGGIDTLLALQGVENPAERRRRAVGRGRSALDALDALKLALLAGTFNAGALAALKSAAAELADRTGEPDLDNVLAEIELRAEVELAKFGMPPTGPNRPD